MASMKLRLRPTMVVLVLALVAMLVVQEAAAASKSSSDTSNKSGSDTSKSGTDTGSKSGSDTGNNGSSDSGNKGGTDTSSKGGSDSGSNGGSDGGSKGGSDAGTTGGSNGGSDGSSKGGSDAGSNGGSKGGNDGGSKDGSSDGGSKDGSSGGGSKGDSSGGNNGSSDGGSKGGNDGGSKDGSNGGSNGESSDGSSKGGNDGGSKGGAGKPDCKKKGTMYGDPKIVGGDGVMFYFHGRKNQDFCLVSDSDLHINAHFIGKRPDGRTLDFTWVQALGFVFGPQSLTIAAKTVAHWYNSVDQLQVAYNGEDLDFATLASWTSPEGPMTLNRIGATNAVDLIVKEKMGVALTVLPISKEENRVHKYGLTAEGCFAHFDMQFRFYNLSSSVNGVLGQTYQPGFVNPVHKGVAMPFMGGTDRFVSSSLLATDCKTSQYTASAIADGSAMPSFEAVCGSSGLPDGVPGGITCRR